MALLQNYFDFQMKSKTHSKIDQKIQAILLGRKVRRILSFVFSYQNQPGIILRCFIFQD